MFYRTVLQDTVSYRTVLQDTVSYRSVLQDSVSYRTVLQDTVQCAQELPHVDLHDVLKISEIFLGNTWPSDCITGNAVKGMRMRAKTVSQVMC